MKKTWKHDELSNTLCACGKALKARVVFYKESRNARKCYKCYSKIRYDTACEYLHPTWSTGTRRCIASHRTAMGRVNG